MARQRPSTFRSSYSRTFVIVKTKKTRKRLWFEKVEQIFQCHRLQIVNESIYVAASVHDNRKATRFLVPGLVSPDRNPFRVVIHKPNDIVEMVSATVATCVFFSPYLIVIPTEYPVLTRSVLPIPLICID